MPNNGLARNSHPTAFRGNRDATSAPTVAKAVNATRMPMSLASDSPSSLGVTVASSMTTVAIMSTTKAPQRPQASHHVQGRFTTVLPFAARRTCASAASFR